MTRTRATAKKAGTAWESAIVRTLIDHGWLHAERRRLAGAADRGDISGIPGVVIEAKNTAALNAGQALDEARVEKANAGAACGIAWLKRRGRTDPLDGLVVMDARDFLALLREAGY